MRHMLIAGLIVLGTVVSASALDRYPTKKRYVNQNGHVVTIGQTPTILAYAPVRHIHALPPVLIVPILEAPIPTRPIPRLVAVQAPYSHGPLGPINVEPADWPSGRTCCRPGEPYFNEEPNS